MWLSKIKAVIGTVWLYVVAVLVVLLALAGRRNASLREEIAKREAARLKGIADRLHQQAERANQAAVASKREREEAEKAIREGRRDYFEK